MRPARLLLLAGVALACGGGPPPTPQIIYVTLPPTPQIIYVTPPPAPPRVRPVATPPATRPPPQPTATGAASDDQQIIALMTAGSTEVDRLLDLISDAEDFDSMTSAYSDTLFFAQNQQAMAATLQPSSCTLTALRLWMEGMSMLETVAQRWLDFDLSDPENYARSTGEKIGEARNALNARPC
jgi:hypothetical protein